MPYQRVRRSTSSAYRGMAAGQRRMGIPRLSARDQGALRLEKAGVDTVPRLITANIAPGTAGLSSFTFASSGTDAVMRVNALAVLIASAPFITQKALYKEYRLKQIKVHAMLSSLVGQPYSDFIAGNNIIPAYCWIRSNNISDTTGQAYTTIAVMPDCIQKVWTVSENRPEFWTTCTASAAGGEGNWLNTSANPNTAPNTGMFFSPALNFNVELAKAVTTGTVNFALEIEFVVEFRGSLQ